MSCSPPFSHLSSCANKEKVFFFFFYSCLMFFLSSNCLSLRLSISSLDGLIWVSCRRLLNNGNWNRKSRTVVFSTVVSMHASIDWFFMFFLFWCVHKIVFLLCGEWFVDTWWVCVFGWENLSGTLELLWNAFGVDGLICWRKLIKLACASIQLFF